MTSGSGDGETVLRVYRNVVVDQVSDLVRAPVELARELEAVTGSDALDIEYAIDATGGVYLLQVRPLARTRIVSLERIDRRFASEIESMKRFVDTRSRRRPGLFGSTTILGEMPDWNPAEIIGTQPKPLASSLYRKLIMNDVWRESRGLLGYREPAPHQLLVMVGGRPYIDVRSSFNSLIPARIPDELAEKLIDHYLRRLAENPDFHDKVEFEIVITCLTFDFTSEAERLADDDFTPTEIEVLREALLDLTDAIVQDRDGVLAGLEGRVAQLTARRTAIIDWHRSTHDIPCAVEQLLADCIEFGTLPFSVFARNAFIGTAFLRSLVNQNVLTTAEYDRYLLSIDTVASDFVADLDACTAGALDVSEFIARYGHLRPGTYDIAAFTYGERPDMYLSLDQGPAGPDAPPGSPTGRTPHDSLFADSVVADTSELIRASGFTFSFAQLEHFIRTSIQLRESLKFEFTKNLSAALGLIGDFGAFHGMARDDLAFVNIEDFLHQANDGTADATLAALRESSERNRKRYELTCLINLPDLIFSSADVEVVSLQRRRPNFITQRKVIADAFELGSVSDRVDIEGKIVLIENADPGFDWVFSRNIAGMVTKYGGAASHLAIRCAEFGVPAAIGCGEQIYSDVRNAGTIELDCMEQRIASHEL